MSTPNQKPQLPADQEQSSQETKSEQRSTAEWVTFGISLALLLGVVGLVVYDWTQLGSTPPTLGVAQQGEVREASGKYYVDFTVTNTGSRTIENVQVVAELQQDGGVDEQGDQEFDFVAEDETVNGTFVFDHDPQQGDLTLRVASYQLP